MSKRKVLDQVLALSVLLIVLIMIPACSNDNDVTSEHYVHGQDDQHYFIRSNTAVPSMASTEDGYYFISGPQQMYLYYMDKEDMEPVVVCGKPECRHEKETDGEKVLDCNAFLHNSNQNLMHHDSSLYLLCTEDFNRPELVRLSLDAAERESVYAFDANPTRLIMHRGYIYYSIDEDPHAVDKDSASLSKSQIFRVSIKDTSEAELVFENEGYINSTVKLVGYRNSLYFSQISFSSAEMEEQQGKLFRHDIIQGETAEVISDASNFVVSDNKIAYMNIRDMQVYIHESEESSDTLLENSYGIIFSDDQYVYSDTTLAKWFPQFANSEEDEIIREIKAYDMEGSIVNEIDIDDLGSRDVYGADDHYIFIQQLSGPNEHGYINTLWAIDKSEIKNESVQPRKVHEFIPEVAFPGVVTTYE